MLVMIRKDEGFVRINKGQYCKSSWMGEYDSLYFWPHIKGLREGGCPGSYYSPSGISRVEKYSVKSKTYCPYEFFTNEDVGQC